MSNKKVRHILLWGWLAFFIMDLSVFLALFFKEYIEWADLKIALKTINAIFAPYLGAIILYFFNKKPGNKIEDKSSTPGILAIVGSLIWNILILIFLARLLWAQGTIEESLEIIENISALFAWLIAAALGYYFAIDQSKSKSIQETK